ncbi:MAG: hypothetical protein IPN22_08195 [Bacteroidetes bacterium]|nr:hypothetical protein [Bacteroidota bacterium]
MKFNFLLILFLLFTCVHTNAQIAYAQYPLDGNANDISGNNLNGSLISSPISSTNRFNQANKALSLNGSGSYVALPQAFDFPNLSVVGWFKANATGGLNSTTVIYSVDNASLQYGHQKFLLEDVSTFPQVRIQSGDVSYVKQITLNQWHQLAFTRTQTQVKVFIDGVLEYTSNTPGSYHSASGVSYATIGAGYSLSNFLNGSVDDFMIFDVAIPDSQITNLYNSNCNLTTPASISPNGNVAICAGSSATLTASNGTTYSWNNSATTQSISVTQAGVYIVTVTDVNGCTGTASKSVSINPLPNVSLSTPSIVNYYAPPILLSGTPSNGVYFGPGVSGNSLNPSVAGLGLKLVSYSYTNSNNYWYCNG